MGEIKKFARWLRRVRDKYLTNPDEIKRRLDAIEQIINQADMIIPDRLDGEMVRAAREFVAELRLLADKL